MDNYIGPMWSDGKWQPSVEFGSSEPLSEVDRESRLHDSAYAHFKEEKYRIAADSIYNDNLRKIVDRKAVLAGVPLYGNYIKNRASDIATNFASGSKFGGPVGALGSLVYSGIKGMALNYDLAANLDRYKREVAAYYRSDPFGNDLRYAPGSQGRRPVTPAVEENIQDVYTTTRPVAPVTKTSQPEEGSEMFKKKNKVQPSSLPREGVVVNPSVQPYRPLKARKRRAPTAGDYLLYLKYHPNDVAKVQAWLDKNPIQ